MDRMHDPSAMGTASRPRKGLVFAWMVEGIAVAMGLLLAVYAGIEGSDGGPAALLMATLPFAALSVIELTKIPLVGLAFEVRSRVWRVIAALALVMVTGATFENFVFGFERGFNERIRLVAVAEQEVQNRMREHELADIAVPQLTARQAEITARLAALREEVAGIRAQARSDIDDAQRTGPGAARAAQLTRAQQDVHDLDTRRDAELAQERRRCYNNPPCGISVITRNYARQREALDKQIAALQADQRKQEESTDADMATARARRDADLAGRDRERVTLEAELETVRTHLAAAQAETLHGAELVAQAQLRRDERIEHSQLHRLAAVLFGKQDPATIEWTKKVFVISLAAIIAMVGSLLAALHFAAVAQAARAARGPGRLKQALRGYLARRRRRIPVMADIHEALRQRHGMARNLRGWLARRRRNRLPVVVREVIKEVPVDRLKIVFLPLDATEAQVAALRREHQPEAA